MSTYISLITFTEKGITRIKDSTKRAREFEAFVQAHGVKVVGQYWTTGSFDGVLIIEADTEQQALRCLVDLSASGYVKVQSMQAFDAAAFEALIG